MVSSTFNPQKDIPSLDGKVIFITGGTAGLGAGSINELAKHSPAHIFFSGRNQKKADALIANIKKTSPDVAVTFIPCDISSFASVRTAVETFKSQAQRLDILMLNAGIMATPAETSKDGYEMQFATNHLGHALLVNLLLPVLESTASQPNSDVRIINMASVAYKQAPSQGIDFATLKSSQSTLGSAIIGYRWQRYGQSKLAQVLYTEQLAKHHPNITSVSVHPGFVMTGLFEGLPMMTALPALVMSIGHRVPVDQGHYNQVYVATCPKDKLKNGGYYEPTGQLTTPSTKRAKDTALSNKLWDWTQEQF